MNTLIHADVFFFVATIATALVAVALTVALVFLAKILSDIRMITRQVKEEAILFREDIGNLRADIKKEGFRLERFAAFGRTIMNLVKIKKASAKRSAEKRHKAGQH